MRKEVVFAIIVGLILGLVILYGIQIANQSSKQAVSTTVTPTPENSTTITPNPVSLTILSPQNHAVVSTATVKITGKTFSNSSVAISDSVDDALVTSGTDGNFTANLNLTGGGNIIKFTVLKPDQTTDSTKIAVIYTSAKIDQP